MRPFTVSPSRATRPTTSTRRSRSTSLIRSCSRASSSSSDTRTARWAMIGPVSTPASTTCTVHPVTFTPWARASRTAWAPGNAGSRAGWVLITRPPNRSRKPGPRMRMKPALTTSAGSNTATAWASPALVVSAGFMRILGPGFLDRFGGRVINTHPALLPAFPGAHAVRDALAHGVKVTGCTVHVVDAGVDTGPIIAQRAVRVSDDDDEARLHERIKDVERNLLVEVVGRVARDGLTVHGRIARDPAHHLHEEVPLDVLDPLVQPSFVVVVGHPDRTLGDDRAGVDAGVDHVHRAPGYL